MAAPGPNTYVDVTDTFEAKLAALRAHVSQETDRSGQLEDWLRGWLTAERRRGGLGAGPAGRGLPADRDGLSGPGRGSRLGRGRPPRGSLRQGRPRQPRPGRQPAAQGQATGPRSPRPAGASRPSASSTRSQIMDTNRGSVPGVAERTRRIPRLWATVAGRPGPGHRPPPCGPTRSRSGTTITCGGAAVEGPDVRR